MHVSYCAMCARRVCDRSITCVSQSANTCRTSVPAAVVTTVRVTGLPSRTCGMFCPLGSVLLALGRNMYGPAPLPGMAHCDGQHKISRLACLHIETETHKHIDLLAREQTGTSTRFQAGAGEGTPCHAAGQVEVDVAQGKRGKGEELTKRVTAAQRKTRFGDYSTHRNVIVEILVHGQSDSRFLVLDRCQGAIRVKCQRVRIVGHRDWPSRWRRRGWFGGRRCLATHGNEDGGS
jgi:hypothetical protein